MTTVTISSKGEVVIPAEHRDQLNLKAGTEVALEVQGEALVMKRVVRELPHWKTTRGISKGTGSLTKALEEERAAEQAHYDARIKGR